ncbi:MAG: DUF5687 family protein [Owenweeksia sp.]
MYTLLLSQQWKKTVRSRYFSQGWGVKILVGFLILYFGLSFLFLGFALPEIIMELKPGAESVTKVFSEYLLYYLLADVAIRFFVQDLNMLSVRHYLLQPVRKSTVIHFLLGTSIFNFFNLLPLFFVIPFTFRGALPELGVAGAAFWLIAMLGLVKLNHYLAIYLKRVIALKQIIFIAFAVFVALIFVGDILGWFSLSSWSFAIFRPMGAGWFIAVPGILVALVYLLNFRFLKAQSYIDKWTAHSKEASTQEFNFLESKGAVGTMISNELKLIIRNKRTKSILFITLLFSLYGLIFYGEPQYEDSFLIFIFVGIFMTGIFMINYGQFMVGWESAYFDGILTRAYPMEAFFRAKFWLLASSAVITYILSTGYVYFGMKALYINTACFLYNIGVNTFVLLYASTYQRKRIDLTRGSAFNYQGTSAVQFLIILPLMVMPVLIWASFNAFGKPYWGVMALAAAGLVSLLFHKQWFAVIIENFKEKKYRNAKGFREA